MFGYFCGLVEVLAAALYGQKKFRGHWQYWALSGYKQAMQSTKNIPKQAISAASVQIHQMLCPSINANEVKSKISLFHSALHENNQALTGCRVFWNGGSIYCLAEHFPMTLGFDTQKKTSQGRYHEYEVLEPTSERRITSFSLLVSFAPRANQVASVPARVYKSISLTSPTLAETSTGCS